MKKGVSYKGMLLTVVWILLQQVMVFALPPAKIIVDKKGTGDFTSIQAAINSIGVDNSNRVVIFIKKGVYNEKVFIEKNNITLEGESKDKTVLTQSIARDEWRCEHPDDWGVATLNINGNDITLMNLTVVNDYGFVNEWPRTIDCVNDTAHHQKEIARNGHQMALRTIKATRLKAINCTFKAFGGDTVSPWNTESGMFYFKDCRMEGGVDFYCPRGWAYAEGCTFVAHNGPAAIWHDGSGDKDSKTVLRKCTFEGYEGFKLGRYHRDAQFYLVDCTFAASMADTPIYRVPTSNNLQWGDRVYYYNCHRKGGDYKWFADNLTKAEGNPKPAAISADWVFGEQWKVKEEGKR